MGIPSKTFCLLVLQFVASGGLTCLLAAEPIYSSAISGSVWNDTNRDGLQETGEPVFTNAIVYLVDVDPQITIATNYTDAAGKYAFTNVTSGSYRIHFSVTPEFGITTPDAGDDNYDSDVITYSFFSPSAGTATFDFVGDPITNISAGFVVYTPGIHISVQAGQAQSGQPLFVTNGTWVPFTYVVSNTGDIALSSISIYDYKLDAFVGEITCPFTLPNTFASSFLFSSLRHITSSETNTIEVIGIAVNPLFCNQIDNLSPAITYTQSVIMVVSGAGDTDGDQIPNAWEIRHQLNPLESNSPEANADGDWMTDYEEYLADTDPTNAASFFITTELTAEAVSLTVPTSSVDRVYGIYSTETLMDDPQYWASIAQEQTGTGAAITFTITNDSPGASFRTGVRLP